MTSQDDGTGRTAPSGPLSAAARHAQDALEDAKKTVAGVRTKAAEAASALYREGRELLANNEEFAEATDRLSESIRKNPLAAVGIAFTAGLLLALLTRG